ncbi:MAG TPA: M23 family metallopeptidase [Pyrinomonadaceae bacterium]|jgi:murein DD-endopeptidase MepM/ murein hydrolase activator NlpD
MSTFPLAERPSQSYRTGGRRFGDDRGSMLHPACDLMAVAGTEVYAVEDGTILYGPRAFFESGPHVPDPNDSTKSICKPGVECLMVYDMLVKHKTFLARYGEIGIRVPKEIKPGAVVKEGQLIAYVGAQTVSSMLHFEMYSNPDDITYPTVKNNMQYLDFKTKKTYHRRKDLKDPTDFLDGCLLMWMSGFPE